uniref:hypothetical protein n=1 Tax=uncultured Methanobrevibacter sp. TaxID=253161 RepID=UPI0025D4D3EA
LMFLKKIKIKLGKNINEIYLKVWGLEKKVFNYFVLNICLENIHFKLRQELKNEETTEGATCDK